MLKMTRSGRIGSTRGAVSPWLLAAAAAVAARMVLWLAVLALLGWLTLGNGQDRDVVGRGPASFEESYSYADGLVVTVVEISRGRLADIPYSDDLLVQPGDPYAIITVALRNDSRTTFEASFVGRLTYGPHQRQAGRFATRSMDDSASVQLVPPGATSEPYSLGFLLPADAVDHVVLELTIDAGRHRTALFAGTLKVLPKTIR